MTIFCYKKKNMPVSADGVNEFRYHGNYYQFEFVKYGKSLDIIDWPFPLLMNPEEALDLISDELKYPDDDPDLWSLAWNWYLEGGDLHWGPEPEGADYELYLWGCQGPWDGPYCEWLVYNKDELTRKDCVPYIDMDEVDSIIVVNPLY